MLFECRCVMASPRQDKYKTQEKLLGSRNVTELLGLQDMIHLATEVYFWFGFCHYALTPG